MKGIVYSKRQKNNLSLSQTLKNYVLIPARAGLLGFVIFFVFLVLSKFLGYMIGSLASFKVDFEDVTLSLLGFGLVFLIKFLENIKDEDSSEVI